MTTDRFRRYREHDPVHWHQPSQAWLVTRYDDVAALLADPRLTSATLGNHLDTVPGIDTEDLAAFYQGWLSLTDGPRHKDLRTLVAPLLAPARVAPWLPTLREIARDQAREEDFAQPYAARVLREVLGLTREEFAEVLPATGRLLRLIDPRRATAEGVPEALTILRETERRLAHRQGLLHGLHVPEGMRGAILAQFVAGGYEPLISCLTAYAAAPHTDLEETLRLHAPFEILPRTATEPVTVGGHDLQPNARVLLAVGSANHDENRAGSLTFGGGRHRCPAASLGRAAVGAAAEALDRRAGVP